MKILKVIGIIIIIIVVLFIILLAYLSLNEYYPKEKEKIELKNEGEKTIAEGQSIKFLSFNTGYGALDKDHDFFMDGGKNNTTESKENIIKNVNGINEIIVSENADIVFLQEVDMEGKRSYNVNQVEKYSSNIGYQSAFARNFYCKYIPYPIPDMIGKVNGGIVTLSKFNSLSATRIPLPTDFKWPIRICQLKRCLLVQRIPVENTNKELVIINLHLEAYDDGTAKVLQTEILRDILIEEYNKGNYVIAGGDFNQTFPNTDPNLYPIINDEHFIPGTLEKDMLPEGFIYANDESVPTSRLLNEPYNKNSENTQYYVIDGFIISPNVKLESVRTLDKGFEFTDHNPVIMTATLGE